MAERAKQRRSHWAWLSLACVAACTGAQVSTPEPEVPAAPQGQAPVTPPPAVPGAGQPMPRELEAKSIPYDEVLAVAGSTVLTESAFREELALMVEKRQNELAAKNPGAKVGPAEIEEMRRYLRSRRVGQIAVADHIHTLGIDPEIVHRVVDRLVREEIEKNRQDAGSSMAFLQQLQALGITYRDFEEKTRTEIRHGLALGEELRKAQQSSPLLATPLEMLDYYQRNREQFVVADEADVEALRFATAQAAQAALPRLTKGESAETIAKDLGGSFSPLLGVTEATGHQPFVKAFALAAETKAGSVSAIVPSSDMFWVLRATRRVVGGVQPFESREVQIRIREELGRERRAELGRRLEEQERARLEMWPPEPVSRDR